MTDALVAPVVRDAISLDNHCDRLINVAWLRGRGLEHMKAALRRNRLVILDEAA